MLYAWFEREVSAENIRGANGYETGTGSLVALVSKEEQADDRECDTEKPLPRW